MWHTHIRLLRARDSVSNSSSSAVLPCNPPSEKPIDCARAHVFVRTNSPFPLEKKASIWKAVCHHAKPLKVILICDSRGCVISPCIQYNVQTTSRLPPLRGGLAIHLSQENPVHSSLLIMIWRENMTRQAPPDPLKDTDRFKNVNGCRLLRQTGQSNELFSFYRHFKGQRSTPIYCIVISSFTAVDCKICVCVCIWVCVCVGEWGLALAKLTDYRCSFVKSMKNQWSQLLQQQMQ